MSTAAYEAKKKILVSQVALLQAKYPHLIAGGGCVTAAKNIRIELKAAFPGVKFSVKTSKFSMGDSVSVRWSDGPTDNQVEQIVGKYQEGSFDGSTDCYNYHSSAWLEAFGGSKYVQTSRHFSDALVERVINRVSRKFGADPKSVQDYRRGNLYSWLSDSGTDLGRQLSLALSRHTCCITKGVVASDDVEAQIVMSAATGLH